MLLHGLQQCRLGLRRRPINLDRQHDGGKQRPLLEAEGRAFLGAHEDVGAGNIRRHQVRRELDPAEGQVQRLAQHPHQVGFPQAGHAFQQYVPPGDHRQQQVLHHLGLADHLPGDFLPDFFILSRKVLNGFPLFHIDVPFVLRTVCVRFLITGPPAG